jgi:poly(3-hydroxybutyrate) depolymerase
VSLFGNSGLTGVVSLLPASPLAGEPISATQAKSSVGRSASKVRTIVFHGSADLTVVPSNADRIVADGRRQFPSLQIRHTEGWVKGRRFKRISAHGPNDVPMVEYWIVEGAGHAWSGGRPEGSFADFQGPDASAEMVRFFLAHECKKR